MERPIRDIPIETDFSLNKPLAYMQSGLSAYSNFSDYIYVT